MEQSNPLADVLLEIADERQYQADKFADGDQFKLLAKDYNENDFLAWTAYINKYATSFMVPGNFPNDYSVENIPAFRKAMIKAATLAVSAVLWADYVAELDAEAKRRAEEGVLYLVDADD